MEKHIEHIPNELKNVHLVLFGNEQSLDVRQGRRVGVQKRLTVCGSSIKIVILSSIFIRSLINHNRLRRRGRGKMSVLIDEHAHALCTPPTGAYVLVWPSVLSGLMSCRGAEPDGPIKCQNRSQF